MRDRSSDSPPKGALRWPSSEVPAAEGNDRHARRRRMRLNGLGDLFGGLGEQNGVGRLDFEPGQRVGVLLAQRLAA